MLIKRFLFSFVFLFSLVIIISANNYSHTLPVMVIETDNHQPILNKKDYLAGTYYIDPMGLDGFEAIGSADAPLSLQIRGRGNFTWGHFDKKPYKIKLDKKQQLLGMNANKHFALLAHVDNDYAFFRNTVAFEISKRIGMPYTPEQRPVEVILNGDYIGLYFLTETIRINKNRVNITKQTDNEQNLDAITGGWLVEIDNNRNKDQIVFSVDETDLEWFWITYHNPEVLSEEQRVYLSDQFESIIKSIYTEDKSSVEWEKLIDITQLAKYYIIQEIVDHLEGFLGSCYLYKDLDETKWKFGPVWDFGHAFNNYHSKHKFIYEESPFPVSIIKEIVKFPHFQQIVSAIWKEFYPTKLEDIDNYIFDFANQIATAAVYDASRWNEYGDANIMNSSRVVISRLHSKLKWLDEQWSSLSDSSDKILPIVNTGNANDDEEVDTKDVVDIVNHTMGKQISTGKFDGKAADINGDGVVNIADIVLILNYIWVK